MPNIARLPAATGAGRTLAPWPQVDRYPVVQGAMSLQTVSSAMRQATSGLRQRYVDILDELLEREPHGQAVLGQRNLTVACSRLEVIPAATKPGSLDEAEAKSLATMVGDQLDSVDDMPTHLSLLLWGNYYGVTSSENHYVRDGAGWGFTHFGFIHTRRLSYSDPSTWDLHLLDGYGGRGIRLDDYPFKFTTHTPRIRGDYPTREGLGRVLGFWFTLKAMAVANSASAVERYARPWALAYFSTGSEGHPRPASEEDIQRANQAMNALGAGSLSSAVLPDSIKVALERVEGGITQSEFIKLCDAQIGEVVLGQNQTTSLGPHGSQAAVAVLKEGSRELFSYDALSLAATLRRDVARSIVSLNRPGLERLTPRLTLHIDRPDPVRLVDLADKASRLGMPVDARALGEMVGLPLVDPDDEDAIRLGPVAPVTLQELQGGTPPPPLPEDVPVPGGKGKRHTPGWRRREGAPSVADSGAVKTDEPMKRRSAPVAGR
jgi:phage gp29-like protein